MVVVTEEGVVAAEAGSASPTLLDIDQAATNSELIELRVQLDRERGLRMILEDQVRSLETQLYPERIREITQQVQMQYSQHQQEVRPKTTHCQLSLLICSQAVCLKNSEPFHLLY